MPLHLDPKAMDGRNSACESLPFNCPKGSEEDKTTEKKESKERNVLTPATSLRGNEIKQNHLFLFLTLLVSSFPQNLDQGFALFQTHFETQVKNALTKDVLMLTTE